MLLVDADPTGSSAVFAGYFHGTQEPSELEDLAHASVHPTLAPGGYAYLTVWDGQATLATRLFRDLTRWRPALDATTEAFERLVPGLRLEGDRRFGGHGALLARTRYGDESGLLYAGGAAGLQDAE